MDKTSKQTQGNSGPTPSASSNRFQNVSFAGAMFLSLTTIAFIFGAYEIVERVWLSDTYPGLLYYLHILRGVGSSLIVALVVGVYTIGRSPFAQQQSRLLSQLYSPEQSGTKDAYRMFARWMIQARWAFLLVLVTGIVLSGPIYGLRPIRQNIVPLLGVVLVMTGSNIGFWYWDRKQTTYRNQLLTQLSVDVVLLTLLIHWSGGLKNPLVLLLLFHVILSGMLFSTAEAFLFTSGAAVLVFGMGLFELLGWIGHVPFKVHDASGNVLSGLATGRSPLFVFGWTILFMVVMFGVISLITLLRNLLLISQRHVRQETRQREELLEKLFKIQEEERARISRELQDQLGQTISALRMKLGDNDVSGDQTFLKRGLEDLVEEVRNLSSQIHPPALEKMGLVEAVRNHSQKFMDLHDVRVELEVVGQDDHLKEFTHALIAGYRLIQEAMLNAVVHGQAGQIIVIIHIQRDQLRILVEDNGTGFQAEAVDSLTTGDQLGIQGMRERVKFLDGTFQIESEPGKGTRVHAEIPLSRPVESDSWGRGGIDA